MFTAAALLDLHQRSHRAFDQLLDHCATIPNDALARPLDGFGVPTVLEQFRHVYGAERYWLGVVRGEMLVDEDPADRADVAALRRYRDGIVETTRAWLASANDDDVSTRRAMTTWGDRVVELVPAHVVLRTQTHLFQHKGQIAAMCRLLGHPVPEGLDFPLGA